MTIVCATRGGEGSRAAQLAAIAKAKESAEPLIFLFVVDPKSLNQVDESLETAVSRELSWMGQTLLQIAKRRAQEAGIEAECTLQHGNVQDEIGLFIQAQEASLLILGTSRGATANVFGDDAVEQFARSIETETGVKVEVVHPSALR